MLLAMVTGLPVRYEETARTGDAIEARGRLVLPDGLAVQWTTRRRRVADVLSTAPLRTPICLVGILRVSVSPGRGKPHVLCELEVERALTIIDAAAEPLSHDPLTPAPRRSWLHM